MIVEASGLPILVLICAFLMGYSITRRPGAAVGDTKFNLLPHVDERA